MDEAEQISGEVAHSLCSRLTIYLVTRIVFFFSQKSDHKQSSSATVSVLSLSLLCVVCSCSVRYTKIYLCLWPSYFNEIKMEFSDETSNVRMWFRTCERNAVCLSCILNTLDDIDLVWHHSAGFANFPSLKGKTKTSPTTRRIPDCQIQRFRLSCVYAICGIRTHNTRRVWSMHGQKQNKKSPASLTQPKIH